MIFKSFGVCEPASSGLDIKIVSKRYNRTTNLLDIDISTPFPLDDTVVVSIKINIITNMEAT